MSKVPTPEQSEIIQYPYNLVVTARPGSGKTFTVVEKIGLVAETLLDFQGVIAISFTNKSSNDLNSRCRQKDVARNKSFFGTIDKFYIAEIIQPFAAHITHEISALEIHANFDGYDKYRALINLNSCPTVELTELLKESLAEGHIFLNICGETAYYILIHVPESLRYIRARYTHIFVDEYQDCGQIQHQIFCLLVEQGLIGFAVGDLDQAIYAWNNRFPKYLEALVGNSAFKHFPITKNLRCHPSITTYSLQFLGLPQPPPLPASDLRVFKINIPGDEAIMSNRLAAYIPKIKNKYDCVDSNKIGILCKSNSSCRRYGSLLDLPNKVFEDTELDSLWARFFIDFFHCYYDPDCYCIDYVEKYFNPEFNIREYRGMLQTAETLFKIPDNRLHDHSDEIIALARQVIPDYENDLAVSTLLEVLFNEEKFRTYKQATSGELNIMTLHKAKGLEFNIVFLMDLYDWVFPLTFPNVDQQQERNLHYVGITRAIDACYIMQSSHRHKKDNEICMAKPSCFLNEKNLSSFRNNFNWEK
jgi:superfamily I DNA/RNA helicase